VSGTDVGSYPAFDPTILRYGITTAADTDGAVTVDASTDDTSGRIAVDGQPSGGPTASVTLSGLTDGEEISVIITDGGGTTAYSLIYLPAGFPTLTATTDATGVAAGDVFLTLSDFSASTTNYEAVVDRRGVPVYVLADAAADVPTNLIAQPNGDYSVARPPPASGQTGSQLIELNPQFQPVGSYSTVGLNNTDGHDAILEPNGDRWFVAYQANADTGNTDAVIQEQDSQGAVLFQWDSADHVDLAKDGLGVTGADYAHINSIEIMANGDVLASFRHLSQVMEIATHAHDGFQTGDVVWRLGGRRSSFTYVDDPYGGPCAQHTASEIGPDDIMVFDDGSPSLAGAALCVDPADPTGATEYRNHTRVAEYHLDPVAGTATLTWSYEDPTNLTLFAGSAQRLSNGDTMVGWGEDALGTLATEVDSAGSPVWELSDSVGLKSYRALKFAAPDATKPIATVTSPADSAYFAVGQQVLADYSCTDTGGSNLQSCQGSVGVGQRLDTTTPGIHAFTVTATDGAGNTTTVTHSYQVVAPSVGSAAVHRADAAVRALPDGKYVGEHVYGSSTHQEIHQSAKLGRPAHVRLLLTNRGNRTERLRLTGTRGNSRFRISYSAAGKVESGHIEAGSFRTSLLAPGKSYAVTVTITPRRGVAAGQKLLARFKAASNAEPSVTDAVATKVTVRRS
jgi:hypothetical protein